jgi:lysophospholipase L1-like esterase
LNPGRPFASLAAARAAAQQGDLITVLPGFYPDFHVAKVGVRWNFLPGAIAPNAFSTTPPSLAGALLAGGGIGAASLFTNTGGTTPAQADGDAVAFFKDQTGNGRHLLQGTALNQMKLRGGIPRSETNQNEFLTDSTAVTLNGFTAVLVYRMNALREGFNAAGIFTTRIIFCDNSNAVNLYYRGDLRSLMTGVFGLSVKPTGSYALYVLSCGGASRTAWVNLASAVAATASGGTGTGNTWLSFPIGIGPNPAQGDLAGWALYNRQVTSQEVTGNLYPWAVGLGAIDPTEAARVLVMDGDSIAQNLFATRNAGWADVLAGSADAPTVRYNWGRAGYTTSELAALVADVNSCFRPAARNVLCVEVGTNDIAFGSTGVDAWGRLLSYLQTVTATGFDAVVATVMPRTGGAAFSGPQETQRQVLNTLIRNGVAGWAGPRRLRLAEIDAASPYMSDSSDGIHPGNAGHAAIAGVFQAQVDSLW